MEVGQANPSYTLWRWWRPTTTARRQVMKRYYFDDGCHNVCAPYVLPGLVCLFILIGTILLVAGFATAFWIYYDEGTSGTGDFREIYFGLWEQCKKIGVAETTCDAMTSLSLPDWMKACEAMSILALILIVLASGLLIYWLCSYYRNIYLKITIVIILFLAFFVLIATIVVFRVKGEDYIEGVLTANSITSTDFEFQWSFYLFAISSAFIFLAACFLLCVPGYGRHSEVYGDRVAITSRQPPMAANTPVMARRPMSGYVSSPRPMSLQGYGTRGYMTNAYGDAKGYPGLMRGGWSLPRGFSSY